MNDNNAAPQKLNALYSEAFLPYLSRQEMARLRQVNQELYNSSRLKQALLLQIKKRFDSYLGWNEISDAIRNENDEKIIKQFLLKYLVKKKSYAYNYDELYDFYLFLGGQVPFDLIRTKAKQEHRREKWRDGAINIFSGATPCMCMLYEDHCQPGLSLCLISASAILCLSIPPCIPNASCGWLTYTGAATLGTTVGGTTVACLEKKFHIFTCCCEPYAPLLKIDQAHEAQDIPPRIEMVEEAVSIRAEIPASRNSLANCFRGLFFKRNAAPTERSPLITENNSCDPEPSHVTKSL